MSDAHPPIEELLLVVPADPARDFGILAASAIVALREGGRLLCHFEGGRYARMGWHERLCHAAGRLAYRYPTTAFVSTKDDGTEMSVVGLARWDREVRAWVAGEIDDPAALERWTGEPIAAGATEEQRRLAAGRLLSSGGSRAMMAYAGARARGQDPVTAVLATAR